VYVDTTKIFCSCKMLLFIIFFIGIAFEAVLFNIPDQVSYTILCRCQVFLRLMLAVNKNIKKN